MTHEQIAKIMALVDEFATTTAVVAVGRDRALNTQSQTEDAIEARNAIEAALSAPQQAEPLAWLITDGEECFATNEHGRHLDYPESARTPLIAAPTAEQHYEEQPDGTMLPDGPEPDERAEFQSWYEAHLMPAEADWFRRDPEEPDEYIHPMTSRAWEAWQARASKAKP